MSEQSAESVLLRLCVLFFIANVLLKFCFTIYQNQMSDSSPQSLTFSLLYTVGDL